MDRLFIATVLLAACSGTPRQVDTPSETDALEPIDELREALAQDGNAVVEGELAFATYEGCCDPSVTCFGNNPSTPYGTYAIPRIEGETPMDDLFEAWGTLQDPNLTRTFRLREDEALVMIGRTPPTARYLSIRSYLPVRVQPDGSLKTLLASLGPSLNNLVMASERGVEASEVWDQPLVVVTTADAAVEARMHELLEQAGFDPATIHDDRITHEVVQWDPSETSDPFFMLWRVAVDVDPGASEAYRRSPEATVFRVTPLTAGPAVDPHPWPDFKTRGSGIGEQAWQSAFDDLEQAIMDAHPNHAPITLIGNIAFPETLECIELDGGCKTDLRDRYSALAPYFSLDEPEDLAVVFGVNHARTGKGLYSNFALIDETHQMGFLGVNSDEMVGSARHYLPNEPLVDDLYAYTIARDCSGHEEPCLEVPTTCPGVPEGERMRLTFRTYLEPGTGAAPLPTEIIADRITRFWGE